MQMHATYAEACTCHKLSNTTSTTHTQEHSFQKGYPNIKMFLIN